MPNVNGPYGLRPLRHMTGGTIRSAEYSIASGLTADIFSGDPVKMTGEGRDITIAPAGNSDNIGVFAGVHYTDSNGQPTFAQYWPTGLVADDAVAYVYDDPNIVFSMQATTVAVANIGQLADWTDGAGNPQTGNSGREIDGASYVATGGSMRVQGIIDSPDNEYGAYASVEVVFAEHVLKGVVAGVGGN